MTARRHIPDGAGSTSGRADHRDSTRPARAPAAGVAIAAALAVAAALVPGTALAAPPANDGPGGATDVGAVTAENGTVLERQGVAELLEATADAGVPRCLGASSFARTAWFKVPATATPGRLRLSAIAPAGGPDATPDLAAFVQPGAGGAPATTIPQACDGSAAKSPGLTDTGATVELDVPENRDVLVQVGAPDDSALTQVTLSAVADALPAAAAPVGDVASAAKRYPLGRARLVPLGGARLTEEDPAAPACPAPASIWRRVAIRQSGLQVAAASGRGVAALTVFLGARPQLTNGAACAPGTGGLVEVPFRARRGQRAWVRVGTVGADAPTARLAVSGPCQQTPLRRVRRTTVRVASGARTARAVRLRLSLRGPCVRGARVVVRQRGRTVARGRTGRLVRGTRTVRVRRVAGVLLRAGTVRVTVRAPKLRTRAAVRLR